MELMNTVTKPQFDPSQIHEGDLIYVRCKLWDEAKKGIVLRVSPERITFLYHPRIANVTNLQTVTAEDAADAGMGYTIRWTPDVRQVFKYTSGDVEAPDPPEWLEEEGGD